MSVVSEQVKQCRVCTKRSLDVKKGLVCSLTNRKGDFITYCINFEEDEQEASRSDYIDQDLDAYLVSNKKRFANYIIDWCFQMILAVFIGVFLGMVYGIWFPEKLASFENVSELWNYIVSVLLAFVYYTLWEGFSGRSVGKYITGSKVVTDTGDRPSFGSILIRSLCRIIPFDNFSFLGDPGKGWHDNLSKTRVVSVSYKKNFKY